MEQTLKCPKRPARAFRRADPSSQPPATRILAIATAALVLLGPAYGLAQGDDAGELPWGAYPMLPDSGAYLEAATSGDVETLKRLIAERPELRFCGDEKGRSGYVLGFLNGHRDVAETLVKSGYLPDLVEAALIPNWNKVRVLLDENLERINEHHPVGGTVLYGAARLGRPQLWRLLNRGADPDANFLGEAGVTAAFGAVECADPLGAYASAVSLFTCGADINARQRGGWSVLHAAVARDHLDLVRFLIRRGADVEARDDQGRTPLDVARSEAGPAMVGLVENHESIPRDGESTRFAFDSSGEPVVLPDVTDIPIERRSKFCVAAQSNAGAIESNLREDPRLAFVLSGRGELAIENAARSGRIDIVQTLLDHGAPQSLATSLALGDLERARALLEEDPTRIYERSSIDHPMMWFCAIGLSGIDGAKLLLEFGAEVDQESLGTTALHWAARNGKAELVTFLLEKGARPDAVGYTFSRAGRAARQIAESRRHRAVVEILDKWISAADTTDR